MQIVGFNILLYSAEHKYKQKIWMKDNPMFQLFWLDMVWNDSFHNSSFRSILMSSVSKINVASGGIVSPAPALPYAKSDGMTNRRFSPKYNNNNTLEPVDHFLSILSPYLDTFPIDLDPILWLPTNLNEKYE